MRSRVKNKTAKGARFTMPHGMKFLWSGRMNQLLRLDSLWMAVSSPLSGSPPYAFRSTISEENVHLPNLFTHISMITEALEHHTHSQVHNSDMLQNCKMSGWLKLADVLQTRSQSRNALPDGYLNIGYISSAEPISANAILTSAVFVHIFHSLKRTITANTNKSQKNIIELFYTGPLNLLWFIPKHSQFESGQIYLHLILREVLSCLLTVNFC